MGWDAKGVPTPTLEALGIDWLAPDYGKIGPIIRYRGMKNNLTVLRLASYYYVYRLNSLM
jgi:hypothetical protein